MIHNLTDGFIGVEVPEDAKDIEISFTRIGNSVLVYEYGDKQCNVQPIKGQYKIIGKADSLTDDQWRGILEPVNNPFIHEYMGNFIYRDYTKPQSHTVSDARCEPIESGLSLLASKNLNPSTILILKKL